MGLRAETSRSLALTVTTTNCAKLREEPYTTRLEIAYDYLLEYSNDNTLNVDPLAASLIGVGNAIAYGLASELDGCDSEGRPLYAVELASWHEVLESGYCSPVVPGNQCKVIRGVTAIRSDANDTGVDAEMVAFDAIEGVISEPSFLDQFVPMSFDNISFGRVVSTDIKPKEPTSGTGSGSISLVPVFVAAATLFALIVTFITGYIWKRRAGQRLRTTNQPTKTPSVNGKTAFLLGSAPPRYYELDDDPEGGGASVNQMLDILGGMENFSTTWSVSDMTSESGSILSNHSNSKTTNSKLERIEEERIEEEDVDDWDENDTVEGEMEHEHALDDSVPPELEYLHYVDESVALQRLDDSSGLQRHLNLRRMTMEADLVSVEESTVELQGCRYVEDILDSEGLHSEDHESTGSINDLNREQLQNDNTEMGSIEKDKKQSIRPSTVSVEEASTDLEGCHLLEDNLDTDEAQSDKESTVAGGSTGYEHSVVSAPSTSDEESLPSEDSDSMSSADHKSSIASSVSSDSDSSIQSEHGGTMTERDLSLLLASYTVDPHSLPIIDADTIDGAADDEHSVSTTSSANTREVSNETSAVSREIEMEYESEVAEEANVAEGAHEIAMGDESQETKMNEVVQEIDVEDVKEATEAKVADMGDESREAKAVEVAEVAQEIDVGDDSQQAKLVDVSLETHTGDATEEAKAVEAAQDIDIQDDSEEENVVEADHKKDEEENDNNEEEDQEKKGDEEEDIEDGNNEGDVDEDKKDDDIGDEQDDSKAMEAPQESDAGGESDEPTKNVAEVEC